MSASETAKKLYAAWKERREKKKAALAGGGFWKKVRRNKWKSFYLASAAMSTILQILPAGVATTSLDDHLREKGMEGDMQKFMSTKDIRVHSRTNPLYVWREAGDLTHAMYISSRNEAKDFGDHLQNIAWTPVAYGVSLFSSSVSYLMTPLMNLDAHSLSPDQPLDVRSCQIRPPSVMDADTFVNEFTRLDVGAYKFKSSPESLKRVFYRYVMAHEGRHCDQNKKLGGSSLNESDADLYAFRLLDATEKDRAAVTEAKEIIQNVRIMNALVGGDSTHFSSYTLWRMDQTPLEAQHDYSNADTLSRILENADDMNSKAFSGEAGKYERFYHLSKKLLSAGALDTAPALKDTAEKYISSVDYFNRLAGGRDVLKEDASKLELNVSFLTQQYVPAPDKVPSRARPNA